MKKRATKNRARKTATRRKLPKKSLLKYAQRAAPSPFARRSETDAGRIIRVVETALRVALPDHKIGVTSSDLSADQNVAALRSGLTSEARIIAGHVSLRGNVSFILVPREQEQER